VCEMRRQIHPPARVELRSVVRVPHIEPHDCHLDPCKCGPGLLQPPREARVKTSDSVVKIVAPASKVWLALTVPELVKQWQYGSDLLTSWEPGTPIIFRNEWNGHVFEQKGRVLEFIPGSRLRYSLFFPRPDLQDVPEHHFFMTYELTERGGITSLLFRQEDPRPSSPDASSGGDDGPDVLSQLKELVERKMP
jgi:uncharacterized protein YndB with AHSA1/START domain